VQISEGKNRSIGKINKILAGIRFSEIEISI
jgi:hypothetical protein